MHILTESIGVSVPSTTYWRSINVLKGYTSGAQYMYYIMNVGIQELYAMFIWLKLLGCILFSNNIFS